jgi:anti-sigma regulatory factor (Ser/Thr protein kinase)
MVGSKGQLVSAGVSAAGFGNVHEAGFYSSDDDFLTLIVPFVEEGVDAGEAIIIGYDERKAHLLRGRLRNPSAVTFSTDTALYATPAGAIAAFRRLFTQHAAGSAAPIRIAGDVPHPGNGGRFHGWDRYESAANTVWDDFPVHSRCLYDATTISIQVRDVVERSHPHLLTANGLRAENPRYEDPARFKRMSAVVDPIEWSTPVVELHNPTPAQARDAVKQVAAGRLDEVTFTDLVLGVSEAADNAQVHGQSPTRVRIWTGSDRVLVHIRDSGHGPLNPLAGLVPVHSAVSAGLGLWLIHQLNLDVDLLPDNDGYTVRMVARTARGI